MAQVNEISEREAKAILVLQLSVPYVAKLDCFAGVIFNRFVKPLTAVVKSVRYTALPVYVPTTWQPVGKSDWGQLRKFSAEFLDAFT